MTLTATEPRAPEKVRIMTISQATDLYLGELAGIGRSVRTVDRYRRFLDKLADAYPLVDVEEITSPQLRRFLDTFRMNAKKGHTVQNSPATIAQVSSIFRAFFAWLAEEDYIKRNPAERIKRPRLQPAHENDNVVSVSSDDVRALMLAATDWTEKLTVYLAVYTGARRRALSTIRRRDYDIVEGTLRFTEKGGKIIEKPVARPLAELLNSAVFAGVYETDDDYLIPSYANQRRTGDRDDRIVWKTIGRVAARAGVETHVHALRAAFATHYLETMPENVLALQELMGHKRLDTTLIYLRRLNRRQAMETVRDLDWGLAPAEDSDAPISFQSSGLTEKEGFEPSFPVKPPDKREGTP